MAPEEKKVVDKLETKKEKSTLPKNSDNKNDINLDKDSIK